MQVNSQGALNSWVSSRARQLTKDHQNLGACSPRETHIKEPTSTHKSSSYVLLVGMPICPKRRKAGSSKPKTPSPRQKRLSREPTPSPRQKPPREAKSKHLVDFSLAGFRPSSLFSLSYASWAACALKGNPRHRASRDLTS